MCGPSSDTVAAWDVTVRASASSTTDIDGRLFTYAWVAYTAGNDRPIYSSLYYVTQDGYRYQQTMRGLDPNGFALYANESGFLDNGEPLYKDLRGNNALVNQDLPAGVTSQPAQYPIFFSDIGPNGGNTTSADLVLTALGIPLTPPTPELSTVSFTGNQGGNTSTVGAGGTFTFTTSHTITFQIVISLDGNDFDPAKPSNRVITGLAASGTHQVYWDGKDNSGANFPSGGPYDFRVTGQNGNVHFPIIDAEGNGDGGPTITKLNGSPGDSTVFYDDRGYVTREGEAVGTLNSYLCGSSSPTPPTPDHSLTGIDSGNDSYNSNHYYRRWPGHGNSNSDCSSSAGFGDAKGLDLWAYQSTNDVQQNLYIVRAPAGADVGTAVTVPDHAYPGDTVSGSFVFRNDGQAAATGVTYTATIGTPGNCPASVNISPLANISSYNSSTCEVTFTGLPGSLVSGQQLTFNFNYQAPSTGPVPVTTTIDADNDASAPNTASGSTAIIAADVTTAV